LRSILVSAVQTTTLPQNTPETGAYQADALTIRSPAMGSIFHLSPEFDPQAQRIQLEAVGQPDLRWVTLWMDGVQIAHLESAPYHIWWRLTPGEHHLWAEALTTQGTKLNSPVVIFEVK